MTRQNNDTLTAREAGTLRRLDRKIMSGKKVTHAEIERAMDLKRKKGAGAALLNVAADDATSPKPRFQNIIRALEDDASDIWEWGRDAK